MTVAGWIIICELAALVAVAVLAASLDDRLKVATSRANYWSKQADERFQRLVDAGMKLDAAMADLDRLRADLQATNDDLADSDRAVMAAIAERDQARREVERLTREAQVPEPEPLIDDETRKWMSEPVEIDPFTHETQPRWEALRCQHCRGIHFRACPRVREIEYADGGAVRRVVFWPEGRYDDSDVIYPDLIFTAAEADSTP